MEVVLRKIGGSIALVMPPSVLRALRIGAGQRLTLDITDGKIVLAPKQKFVLADMIAQCDMDAPPPADLSSWDGSVPSGNEVL
jgi:antitoxin ChpS